LRLSPFFCFSPSFYVEGCVEAADCVEDQPLVDYAVRVALQGLCAVVDLGAAVRVAYWHYED
jgi:hypothetical protein